jgi:hypothetical protein
VAGQYQPLFTPLDAGSALHSSVGLQVCSELQYPANKAGYHLPYCPFHAVAFSQMCDYIGMDDHEMADRETVSRGDST